MTEQAADKECLDMEYHSIVEEKFNLFERFADKSRMKLVRNSETKGLQVILAVDQSRLRRLARTERFRMVYDVFKDQEGLYRRSHGTHTFAKNTEGLQPLRRNCNIRWFEQMVVEHLTDINLDVRKVNKRLAEDAISQNFEAAVAAPKF